MSEVSSSSLTSVASSSVMRSPSSSSMKADGQTARKIVSPHGTLPLRRLASIKIIDKCSCYVIGLNHEIANEETLCAKAYFAQFGDVVSIRILQNKDPSEVYIRFDNLLSAGLAINWCNAKECNANHGYHKYCMRFLKNKKCCNLKCANRHSWCSADDVVIIKKKEYKAFGDNTSIFNSDGDGDPDPAQEMNYKEQMNVLQRQFMILQNQHNQQNEFVQDLISTIHKLKSQNRLLRDENRKMAQRFNLQYAYDRDDYYPSAASDVFEIQGIDRIVDCVIQSDEQDIDSTDSNSSGSRSDTSQSHVQPIAKWCL